MQGPKSRWNDRRFGMITGLILPIITIIAFWAVRGDSRGLVEYLLYMLAYNVLTQVIALCVLPNLALFYLYLRKEYYESGWGVIFATTLFTVGVAIYKFS